MDDPARSSIEQELRDERARRRDAEQRLGEVTDRAELWRTRAEERTERIERLLAAQKRPANRLRRWLGVGGVDTPGPGEPAAVGEAGVQTAVPIQQTHSWPTQKSVVVVAGVTDVGKLRALQGFDLRPLDTAGDADLDRADFVVYEPGHPGTRDRLLEWGKRAGRQPLIIWSASAPDPELTALAEIEVSSDPDAAARLGMTFLPGCFDPGVHSPSVAAQDDDADIPASLDISAPTLGMIERAASGKGFSDAPGAATLTRRWAYRNHAPWVRAQQIQVLAGIPARHPRPGLAALLVSHRVEDIPAAIRRVAVQTLEPSEMVVVVHGAELTPEIERTASECPFPVELISAKSDLTLGECLNIAGGRVSAPILAKLDDDDHYGPAYLEDSFHAICYSGADIVGKGAHYTYLSGADRTVLRRPGLEEQFIEGSPNGATLVFRRSIWEAVGFPHRPRHVDTGFLRAARLVGGSVYATSRWEFCYVRNPEGHTWDAEDEVFLAGAEPAWDGFQPGEVELGDLDGA